MPRGAAARVETTVSAGAIAVPLLVTMLLPLAVGMVLREWRPTWERMLRRVDPETSTVALLLLVAATVCLSTAITDLVVQGALPALLVIGARSGSATCSAARMPVREVLGLGTSQRNIAAATMVASELRRPASW